MARSLMLYWRKVKEAGRAGGFTDILPLEWFAAEGKFQNFVHVVEGPWQGRKWRLARFDLQVRRLEADLHYEKYQRFNQKRDMDIGTMQVIFRGPHRAAVEKVRWKDEAFGSTTLNRLMRPSANLFLRILQNLLSG
jgi:hypothetical protein